MQVGDYVRVKAPFDAAFAEVYQIEGQNPVTGAWIICGDRDFDEVFLEPTSAP